MTIHKRNKETWLAFAIAALAGLAFMLVCLPWHGDAQKEWDKVAAQLPPVRAVDYAPGHYGAKYFVLAAGPGWLQQCAAERKENGELCPALDNACTRFARKAGGVCHTVTCGEDGFELAETTGPECLVCFFHPGGLEKIPGYDTIDRSVPFDRYPLHVLPDDLGLAVFILLPILIVLANGTQVMLFGLPRSVGAFVYWYMVPALALTLYFAAVGLMDRNFDHSPAYFHPHLYLYLIPACAGTYVAAIVSRRLPRWHAPQ